MSSFLAAVLLLALAAGAQAAVVDLGGTCTSSDTCTNSADSNIGLACDLKLSAPVCAIKVTQSCADNTDKCVTGATCNSGTSVCECTVTGYEDDATPKLCKVSDGKIGGTCSSSIACGQNAACPASGTLVCACNSGYTASNGATDCTVMDGRVGGTCSASISCGQRASCPSSGTKVCACETGFEAVNGETDCKVSSGKIGGDCTDDNSCGTNTYCPNAGTKVCLCKSSYTASAGQPNCAKSGASGVAVSALALLLSAVIALRCFQ